MVGSVSSGSGGYDTAVIEQLRAQAADRMLKRVDSNQDGKITEDELSRALEASGNKQTASVSELFKQLDQGGKGYITKQDIEDGLAREEQAKAAQAQQPAKLGRGGAPAAGGAGTSYSYDPADLNQDGVVTTQERIQYILNLYAAQKEVESQ